MLDYLAAEARARVRSVPRLETGIYQTEAITLCEQYGFERIPQFG